MLFQQQVTKLLLKTVDRVQRWIPVQLCLELAALLGLEVMAMTAHQRQQSAALRRHRVQFSPAVQAMLIDQPDDMEAIGNDFGLGEVFSY